MVGGVQATLFVKETSLFQEKIRQKRADVQPPIMSITLTVYDIHPIFSIESTIA
jgi:hypothetical protein